MSREKQLQKLAIERTGEKGVGCLKTKSLAKNQESISTEVRCVRII